MKQYTKEEQIKTEIIWKIMYGIKQQMDAETEAAKKYVEYNSIGNPKYDEETKRERERISFIIADTFRIAQEIAVDAVRKASIPC